MPVPATVKRSCERDFGFDRTFQRRLSLERGFERDHRQPKLARLAPDARRCAPCADSSARRDGRSEARHL